MLCSRHQLYREEAASLSQVPVSAGGEAHEEDLCLQCQRLHAAVRPAGQEARVLVRCATGEVGAASIQIQIPHGKPVVTSLFSTLVCLLWTCMGLI